MGTRHMQMAITKAGDTKLENYGQWDGYPSGQGVDILTFLKQADLDKYDEKLQALREATQEDYDSINAMAKEVQLLKLDYMKESEMLRANKQYDSLTRDCGSRIHQYILDGEIDRVSLDKDGHDHAAYSYVIDLQKRTFSVSGYDLEVKSFSLDDLPSEEVFLNECEPQDEEE